jgi:hypothetical protein
VLAAGVFDAVEVAVFVAELLAGAWLWATAGLVCLLAASNAGGATRKT